MIDKKFIKCRTEFDHQVMRMCPSLTKFNQKGVALELGQTK